jgi:hypothetical protein
MSVTGLEVFDTTVHKTNGWLRELMDELDWPDRHKAYLALRATLHALRLRDTGAPALRVGTDRSTFLESLAPRADRPRSGSLQLQDQEYKNGGSTVESNSGGSKPESI